MKAISNKKAFKYCFILKKASNTDKCLIYKSFMLCTVNALKALNFETEDPPESSLLQPSNEERMDKIEEKEPWKHLP